MLEDVLRYLRNWFPVGTLHGSFEISYGVLLLPAGAEIMDGQYVRIVGSVFNDGLYRWPAKSLTDETFDGAVWLLAIPPRLLQIVAEIEEWQAANAQALQGPYTSESFGGYSYTKKSAAGVDGGSYTWKDEFASRLAGWRKI